VTDGDRPMAETVDETDESEELDAPEEDALIEAFTEFVRASQIHGRPAVGHEALLSVAHVATYLNVSTSTVRNLALGGSLRFTRIGDRLRFRRNWLDEFIDAGGGEVPAPPARDPRPIVESGRRRSPPRPARPRPTGRPKPSTYVQLVGEQELRMLSDAGSGTIQTWHVGDRSPLCGLGGLWSGSTRRWPRALLCTKCLTALGSRPGADLALFGVGRVAMMRQTHRGATVTAIRTGFHIGNGRRTLCGKSDGPWSLTERIPRTKRCFVCEHRERWEARDDDPNILSPRPLTPLRVLLDTGPIDPPLRALLEAHPRALDARQAREPLTERIRWDDGAMGASHARGERIGQFTDPGGLLRGPDQWSVFTISDRVGVAFATTQDALERLPEWAEAIERALALYARWAKEPRAQRVGR
jgi:excisionase family DNA binding protein